MSEPQQVKKFQTIATIKSLTPATALIASLLYVGSTSYYYGYIVRLGVRWSSLPIDITDLSNYFLNWLPLAVAIAATFITLASRRTTSKASALLDMVKDANIQRKKAIDKVEELIKNPGNEDDILEIWTAIENTDKHVSNAYPLINEDIELIKLKLKKQSFLLLSCFVIFTIFQFFLYLKFAMLSALVQWASTVLFVIILFYDKIKISNAQKLLTAVAISSCLYIFSWGWVSADSLLERPADSIIVMKEKPVMKVTVLSSLNRGLLVSNDGVVLFIFKEDILAVNYGAKLEKHPMYDQKIIDRIWIGFHNCTLTVRRAFFHHT